MRWAWKAVVRAYPFGRGRIRLINFARRRIAGMVIDHDRYGNRLLLDLDNLIDGLIYLEGSYEHQAVHSLSEHARRRSCTQFIDVGANLGVYSLHFARDATIKQVWAFEPDPRNRSQLVANLWLNQLYDRVRVFDDALSDQNGQATFYVNTLRRKRGELSYNTASSSLLKAGSPLHEPIAVPLRRLDEVIHLKGQNLAIKIDVEGAEQMVLNGARALLEANRCLVMVEIWNHPPDAVEKGIMYMNSLGYQRIPADIGSDNYLFENG